MHGISNREAVAELDKYSNTYPFPMPRKECTPAIDNLAPLARRHDVYYDLLGELRLNDTHLLDLLGRGLSLGRIRQNMYRSMPVDFTERARIARKLASLHDLRGVPGFYLDPVSEEWRVAGRPGILVPYCTAVGYIQAVQIRLDDATNGKCRWLSSNPEIRLKDGSQAFPNGTAARTWVHITGDPNSSIAHVTEGAIKGDVASFLEHDALYICVPGVGSIKYLLPAITSLPNIKQIISLFDMDQIEREQYSKPLQKMIKTLQPLGIPVEQKMWNPSFNGIDEYKLHCRTQTLAA